MSQASDTFSAAWSNPQVYHRIQGLLLPAITDHRRPRVFEWGPGFSTLFFAVRKCAIVTVEHDEEWLQAQRHNLETANLRNVDLRFRPPKARDPLPLPGEIDASDPWQYASGDDLTLDYHDYVQEIHAQPRMYDIVYIDGRARPSCLVAAESHVAEGGHILLHDANRKHYDMAKAYLSDWDIKEIDDRASQLAIWSRK